MTDDQSINKASKTELSSDEYKVAINAYWKPSYETLYHVTYQESLSSALAERWQVIDTVTNILVAATASGSAVAGWALWNQPEGRSVWMIIAGFVSLLSIVHGGVQVPTRLKEQENVRRQFSKLRVDLETFRQRLQLGTRTLDYFEKSYIELRDRYADLVNRAPSDIANTYKLRVKIQELVNTLLKDEIREQRPDKSGNPTPVAHTGAERPEKSSATALE